jgi:hypothetical protein
MRVPSGNQRSPFFATATSAYPARRIESAPRFLIGPGGESDAATSSEGRPDDDTA